MMRGKRKASATQAKCTATCCGGDSGVPVAPSTSGATKKGKAVPKEPKIVANRLPVSTNNTSGSESSSDNDNVPMETMTIDRGMKRKRTTKSRKRSPSRMRVSESSSTDSESSEDYGMDDIVDHHMRHLTDRRIQTKGHVCRQTANIGHRCFTRAPLNRLVGTLLRDSLAKSTRQTYRAAYKLFSSFHTRYYGRQHSGKIKVAKLTSFIAYCHSTGMKYSSICSRVSALNYINKLQGAPSASNDFLVKRVLLGCKHSSTGSLRDKRLPITINILKKLHSVLPSVSKSVFDIRLFRAMFSLAFFALLRVGEIAATNNANHTITDSDVSFHLTNGKPTNLSLSITHYKHSTSPFSITLSPFSCKRICPVRTVHAYISHRPTVTGALFINECGRAVTNKQFGRILKKCIRSIGLDAKLYTSHCFRIGGATLALSQNYTDAQIRKLGRWQSNAFHSYLRPTSLTF